MITYLSTVKTEIFEIRSDLIYKLRNITKKFNIIKVIDEIAPKVMDPYIDWLDKVDQYGEEMS